MKNRWLIWSIAAGVVVIVLVTFRWVQQSRPAATFKDEDPAVRTATIRKLPKGGPIELLIGAIEDANPDVRILAIGRLGGAGSQEDRRAWALIPALKDAHAGVRREASWSLSHIGPGAWPALEKALTDADPRMRAGAALALKYANDWKDDNPWPSRNARAIVPVLEKLLSDPDPEVSGNATEALRRIRR